MRPFCLEKTQFIDRGEWVTFLVSRYISLILGETDYSLQFINLHLYGQLRVLRISAVRFLGNTLERSSIIFH